MPANSLIQRLPRQLKMSELRVFMAVLDQRSFQKAAEVVHLTPPAVAKAISSLEETLGVRLFDRHANSVDPTAHGLSLAPRAAAIFDELRHAARDLAALSNGERGSLRVGTVPMPAIPFLPIAIKRLVDAHPNAVVSVVEAREMELVDRLRSRDIEMAILRLSLFDTDADLEVTPLFDERLCVIAGKNHPLAARRQLTWPELLEARWVMPPADCYFFEHVTRTLDALEVELPRHTVESFSINMQFGMVLHGGMLSFGLRSQVAFSQHKELLTRLPLELPSTARAVAAVKLKAHQSSPLAQQLVGHMLAMTETPPR
jgi:DNA-binding transcriptional LysR family regulator